MKYIGHCGNDWCKKYNHDEIFDVENVKEVIAAYRNEPPTCTICGSHLTGDIYDTEAK